MIRPRVLIAGALLTATPTAVIAAPVARPPWGTPVRSTAEEQGVRAFLTALAAGRGDEVAGATLAIGPALWAALRHCRCMAGGLPVHHRGAPARAYRGPEVARILTGDALRLVGEYFAGGLVASATEPERQAYYAVISWEIAGEPLVVARRPDATLVAALGDDGAAFHLELLPGNV